MAVAGASGFVGTSLRIALADKFRWHALTRSPLLNGVADSGDNTRWIHCDLFSLPQVEEALQGADYAIYLVHSMVPTTRLTQASFADIDLLLADNFARACRAVDVRHIVYLGGLMPDDDSRLSEHLASRQEVETLLRSYSIPVTVLRAGIIFGPGGSSARMVINLVRRLPVMVLPRWTRSTIQSIDIQDVIRAVDIALTEAEQWRDTYDISSHEPMTYAEMIRNTATVMGKRPTCVPVPFNAIGLSRLWVSLMAGVPKALVDPLLDSLKHSLAARDNPLQKRLSEQPVSFENSIRNTIDDKGYPLPNPRSKGMPAYRAHVRHARRVRSVQRMPLPEGWDAGDVEREYGRWLSKAPFKILSVEQDADGALAFMWQLPRLCLLRLTPTPRSRNCTWRRAFYIAGGVLSRTVEPQGRFEFRLFPDKQCLIAAIHGYAPRLPWWLYSMTQAVIHLFTMLAFKRHLSRKC